MRWTVFLLCITGCPERAAPPPQASPPVQAAVAPVDAGSPLGAEKLEAWLRYHRALRVSAGPADGGAGPDARARAHAERRAREQEGLTEADVDHLEAVIAAVVTQRTIARLTGAEAVRDFAKVAAGLKPEQRKQVEEAFGDVRSRAQQAASLDAERARFGDETVSLVLAREAEVTEVWEFLMNGRGEK